MIWQIDRIAVSNSGKHSLMVALTELVVLRAIAVGKPGTADQLMAQHTVDIDTADFEFPKTENKLFSPYRFDPVKPPEPKPEDREAIFKRRYDDELDAIITLEKYPEWFDEDINAAGDQNLQAVIQWIKQHYAGYVSRANVKDAITTLKGELIPVPQQPAPSAPIKTAPQARVALAPVVTTPPAVDDLPPLADWVWRQLAGNPFKSYADVRRIPSSLFSELYRGRYGEQVKSRVQKILDKAQGR